MVGNRPQFVKLAVLHKEIQQAGNFAQQIVHSGQHFSYEMDGIFFKELGIPAPAINFNIQGTSANEFIGKATDKLQEYFLLQPGAIVFVYGDTNTTLAAAIAAKRAGLPLVHFEGGVRTGDNSMPEEINRLLTDRLADINFCCTQKNMDTLLAEGYGTSIPSQPVFSGDLMLDAFLQIQPADRNAELPAEYILCTIHRAANLADKNKLQRIFKALDQLLTHTPVLMPLHPHTKKKIELYGISTNIQMLPAVGYPQMKALLKQCSFLITDSGGTCREAYFSKKTSIIIMDKPFWPELLEAGAALRADADTEDILQNASKLGTLAPAFDAALFGNGQAARNIQQTLLSVFGS